MSALKRPAIISLELISSSSTCVSIVSHSFREDGHVDDSPLSIVIIFNEVQTPPSEALNCQCEVFLCVWRVPRLQFRHLASSRATLRKSGKVEKVSREGNKLVSLKYTKCCQCCGHLLPLTSTYLYYLYTELLSRKLFSGCHCCTCHPALQKKCAHDHNISKNVFFFQKESSAGGVIHLDPVKI